MLPSRRSSSRSPAVALASHLHWRSPVASPLSSCGHTPVLDSPVSPYVHPSFIRPTLSASPGISMPNSPAGLAGPIRSSPSPHRVLQNFLFRQYLQIYCVPTDINISTGFKKIIREDKATRWLTGLLLFDTVAFKHYMYNINQIISYNNCV